MKIGIVGCGAIGASLAEYIAREFKKEAALAALYDIKEERAKYLSRLVSGSERLAAGNLKQLIAKSELVIEASSASASWAIAKEALGKGRDLMLMSVGGLSGRLRELSSLAKKNSSKVYIPSGAVSGIDALKAARMAGIKRVLLITRKNPLSFRGVNYIQRQGFRLKGLKKERVLFFGSARKAVKYFPQNINVASVLSLAGIGQDRTKVKIIASPKIKRNIHEVQIESNAGLIFTRTQNLLHPDNPKTSYLAVLSAQAVLEDILNPVKIGT